MSLVNVKKLMQINHAHGKSAPICKAVNCYCPADYRCLGMHMNADVGDKGHSLRECLAAYLYLGVPQSWKAEVCKSVTWIITACVQMITRIKTDVHQRKNKRPVGARYR